MANNFEDKWTPMGNYGGKDIKTFFGTQAKVNAVNLGESHPITSKAFAATGRSWTAMREGWQQNGAMGAAKGIGSTLLDDVKRSTMFEAKGPGGLKYRAERSLPGKILNPLMTSGAGIGLVTALPSKNPDGTKATLGKRLRRGIGNTLGWGLAPPVAAAEMVGNMAYNTAKPKDQNLQNF